MARMSKEMPIKVFAKKVGIDKKEQEWIEKNDKDTHYVNNSALKNSWLSLSYPIYDGDYYFAFINKKARVNAQYNAKANRELRKYITSFLDEDEIFARMEKYFAMQFKDAGSGDTMTREELWTAIVDMRKKNPAPKKPTNESLQEVSLDNNMMQRHFANVWSSKDAKLYRVLSQLISQDGFVDNMKAYKKNPKDYLNRLKDIKKNPKKYAKSFGPNFPQYINNPKPGQNYAKLPESTDLFDTYRQMNLEQQDTFNEASAMGMIDKLFNLKGNRIASLGVAKLLNMTGVKVAQAMQKQNPKGFLKTVNAMGKETGKMTIPTNKAVMKMFKDQGVKPLPESINETKKQEVDAMKKISKDMQSVLKAYQKVSTMGDKTLKDTKHNASYKKVLDARDAILTMIGTLNTQMLLTREETNLWSKLMTEEMITYRVKKMQKPELDKFQKSAKMMRLKLNFDQGKDDTVLVVSGSKKKLRDFDSVVRGKSSYGDPSTIKHFDEK